jgi:hypothetical protein
LFEQGVNKGGFAVIDVGNDSDVANRERHRTVTELWRGC